MNAPRVSVLLPFHNAREFFPETLESLLTQTFTDFEVLALDDGSTDGSHELIEALGDPRFRLIRNTENKGLAATLNIGLKQARAALIARQDADDLSAPTRLEKQVAFMDTHPGVALCGTWAQSFGEDQTLHRYPTSSDHLKATLLLFNPFAHTSIMMREGFTYDESYQTSQDYELWTRIAQVGDLANLPEPLVSLRVHGGQVTQTKAQQQGLDSNQIRERGLAALGLTDPEFLRVHHTLASLNPREGIEDGIGNWLSTMSQNPTLTDVCVRQILAYLKILARRSPSRGLAVLLNLRPKASYLDSLGRVLLGYLWGRS